VLEQGQRQQQRHDARLAEPQRRRLLTVFGDGRLHHPLDAVAAQAAVVADTFDFQQAPIALPPNFLQVRQVGQTLVHVEILGVAESDLHPTASPFVEILSQSAVLILDVQAWMQPFLDDHSPADKT
jgi:hypothetical protein